MVSHEQGGAFGLVWVWIHDGHALRDEYRNTEQHAMPKKKHRSRSRRSGLKFCRGHASKILRKSLSPGFMKTLTLVGTDCNYM